MRPTGARLHVDQLCSAATRSAIRHASASLELSRRQRRDLLLRLVPLLAQDRQFHAGDATDGSWLGVQVGLHLRQRPVVREASGAGMLRISATRS